MSNALSLSSVKRKSASAFKRFLKNTSGSITQMFSYLLIPGFITFGAAVDFARTTREQSNFYAAVDAAALAIAADERAAVTGLTESQKAQRIDELKIYAKKYIDANYVDKSFGEANVSLDLSITGQAINLNAELEYPTLMLSTFGGPDTMTLRSNSRVQLAMRPIELVMVMDTTGSMKNDMSGLKEAANKLLATLYSDESPTNKTMKSEFIRTALVPFSGAVRLDTAAYDFDLGWIDTAGTNPLSRINFNDVTWNNYNAWAKLKRNSTAFHTWNGCVESRSRLAGGINHITSDVAPTSSNINSKFPAYFNPDSPSWYNNSSGYASYWVNGGSSQNGVWNNGYIGTLSNYTTGAPTTSLLAPSGSNRTGYDDSTIGNNSTSFSARFTNAKKYENKNIGEETFSLGGDGVTWSVTRGPWVNCTASKVVPMTYDRTKVEAGIASMRAYGGTNIAEGLAWGMRAISPSEPFTKVQGAPGISASTIAPYNGPRWQKIIVLMTDGENDPYSKYSDGTLVNFTDTGTSYNSFGFSKTTTTGGLNRYGSTSFSGAGHVLDDYTEEMCDSLKANGVTIYTVGFRVDSQLMEDCATSPSHYKSANSLPELVAYFDHIGQDVLNKMVYVSR
jgi:Flp pilus assembly protein TadG